MASNLAILGTLIIFIGFAVIFLATVAGSRRKEDGEGERTGVKGGGVVLIGPIPIIFGSDAKWAAIAIILAILLIAISLVFTGYAI